MVGGGFGRAFSPSRTASCEPRGGSLRYNGGVDRLASPPSSAVVLVAHGSRAEGTAGDHAELAATLAGELGMPVHPAFLEITEPDIPTAIHTAVAAGAREVLLVPYFLLAGNHTRRDIPAFMERAAREHPGVRLRMTRPIGPDPRLVAICADRARDALAGAAAATAGGEPG